MAVHGEHVIVPHAREPPRFAQPRHRAGTGALTAQLERDAALQARIPGFPHLAERTLADPPQHLQRSLR